MLPASKRLTALGVRRVLAQGKARRGKYLSAKILASEDAFRCGVVVSKKVAGRAVMRNSLRRAVYQALRSSSLPPTGHAILFVQAVPQGDIQTIFKSEIKTLLHV